MVAPDETVTAPVLVPPELKARIPALTFSVPGFVSAQLLNVTVVLRVLLNVPLLRKVLGAEWPLNELSPVSAALNVPLLVKVMAGPVPKPEMNPLVQSTVPALVT